MFHRPGTPPSQSPIDVHWLWIRCKKCNGKGKLIYLPMSPLFLGETFVYVCHYCNGRGRWQIPFYEFNDGQLVHPSMQAAYFEHATKLRLLKQAYGFDHP